MKIISGKKFQIKQDLLSNLPIAVAYRHDCVHRNGYTVDGNKLEIFTKKYLELVMRDVKVFWQNVDDYIFEIEPSWRLFA